MASFEMKVLSVHPAYDDRGRRYVAVEFGFEEIIAHEASEALEKGKELHATIMVGTAGIPKPAIPVNRRMALFLTPDEWAQLKNKYAVDDMYQCEIAANGKITVSRKG